MEANLILNVSQKKVIVNGTEHVLGTKMFSLLHILADNRNKLVYRDDILLPIWKRNDYSTSRSMDVHVCNLRKLLSPILGISIENKHGKGHTLIMDAKVKIETIKAE